MTRRKHYFRIPRVQEHSEVVVVADRPIWFPESISRGERGWSCVGRMIRRARLPCLAVHRVGFHPSAELALVALGTRP